MNSWLRWQFSAFTPGSSLFQVSNQKLSLPRILLRGSQKAMRRQEAQSVPGFLDS